MSTSGIVTVILVCYLSINFLFALAFHIHGEHQAHLRLRFLDVFVHFVLMTAFGIPLLLLMTTEALFGGNANESKSPPVSPAGARAV